MPKVYKGNGNTGGSVPVDNNNYAANYNRVGFGAVVQNGPGGSAAISWILTKRRLRPRRGPERRCARRLRGEF